MQKSKIKTIAISNRITVVVVLFLILFFGAIVFQALIDFNVLANYGFIIQTIFIATFVALILFWLRYSNIKKKELIEAGEISSGKVPSDPVEALGDGILFFDRRKVRIFGACFASHIATGVIIASIFLFMGFREYFVSILSIYFFLGWIVTFPLFLKIYSSILE